MLPPTLNSEEPLMRLLALGAFWLDIEGRYVHPLMS